MILVSKEVEGKLLETMGSGLKLKLGKLEEVGRAVMPGMERDG